MAPSNRSDIYGGYGCTSRQNHYVPGPCPPFEPQPATVPITYSQIQTLVNRSSAMTIQEATTFLSANSANIVFRNMLIDKGGFKTFVMFDQSYPLDLLTFTTKTSTVSLTSNVPVNVLPHTIETENVYLTKTTVLTANKNYFIENTTEQVTLLLPQSPDFADFVNINFTKNNHNLVIEGNGLLINTNNPSIVIGNSKVFGLVYSNTITGWEYVQDSSSIGNLALLDGGTF